MVNPQFRHRALDGLRGLAAVVVVVHHALLTQPVLDAANAGRGSAPDGVAGWLTYSPLHLLWAGREAVYVFFVLSGFVLALPFLRDGVPNQWVGYFPRRFVRLYVPLAVAVLLSAAIAWAVPRTVTDGASRWLNRHAGPASILDALTLDSVMALNSALWSLRWEIAFSCLLPMFLAGGLIGRRYWLLKLLTAVAVTALPGLGPAALYLPMFAVGVCLAVGREHLFAAARRVPRGAWWALLAAALLLLNARWTAPSIAHADALAGVVTAAAVLGSAMLVTLFVAWPAARRLGEHPVVGWLGAVSFSLYLVHEPVVVSAALLLGGRANAGYTLLVSLPASLALAWLFHRLVERPSHRLSRRVGREPAYSSATTGPSAASISSAARR
ncbi:acyltransferase [Luedemannella helvata]|uniref:Acyltransferase n=1 Tax=Luedemannella helvata TaxID=349315 RepID=A0ABN2KML3_9ACTN